MPVVLYSYVVIGLGLLLVGAGLVARHRDSDLDDYLLGPGVMLVALGLLSLAWFVRSFG